MNGLMVKLFALTVDMCERVRVGSDCRMMFDDIVKVISNKPQV